MNLLNITSNYLSNRKNDFAGVFIHRQWVELLSKNWDIQVINPQPFLYRSYYKQARYYPHQSIKDGITVYRPRFIKVPQINISRFEYYSYTRAVKNTWKKLQNWIPDIVVCDWLVPGIPSASYISQTTNTPLIARARGYDVRQLQYSKQEESQLIKAYRAMAHRPYKVICNGIGLYEAVISLDLFNHSSIVNQPNGLDITLFHQPTNTERECARHQFSLSKDAIVCVFIGTWEHRKGSHDLAEIIPQILTLYPDMAFVIGGPIKDNNSYELLSGYSQVHFLGSVSPQDIPILLQSADIFILPSYYEGTPNALLEAMATELCCITTLVGGTKAFAESDKNMLIIEPGDHVGLIQALKRAITDKDLRINLGHAARRTIVERGYDLDSVVNELDQLFRVCIQSHIKS